MKKAFILIIFLLLCTIGVMWMLFLANKDAETLVIKDGAEKGWFSTAHTYFSSGGKIFTKSGQATKSQHRKGQHSMLTNQENQFSFSHEIRNVSAGDRIVVSAWRLISFNYAVLSIETEWGFYQSTPEIVERDGSGWEKMELSMQVPTHIENMWVRAYVWNPNEEKEAFFDDFRLEYNKRDKNYQPVAYESPKLEILIEEAGFNKLKAKREEALKKGVLITEDDDWVDAQLKSKGKKLKAEIRLKGDWLDHLNSDQWSFRIKTSKENTWLGMRSFSIQHPFTRHYLSEWVYHKLLDQEDVLTTRYDFVEVFLNGKRMGIYVYEEHFDKHLPEANSRREGPIVKFSEDGMWNVRQRELQQFGKVGPLEQQLPVYNSASIEPFKANRTQKSETLLTQFREAQNLMLAYKMGDQPFSEIFDIDKFARFYALADIAQAYHGIIWHNQRFYFDPVASRLEPIGFDGYSERGAYKWTKLPFIGFGRGPHVKGSYASEQLLNRIFYEPEMTEAYVQYLHQYSSTAFMDSFLEKIGAEVAAREYVLQSDTLGYKWSPRIIKHAAKQIRTLIFPFKDHSVRAYQQGETGIGQNKVRIFNYHVLPIEVYDHTNQPPIRLGVVNAYNHSSPLKCVEFDFTESATEIHYRIPGIDSLFAAPTFGWRAPEMRIGRKEEFQPIDPKSHPSFRLSGNEIYLAGKNHTFNTNLVIPTGYKFYIEAGSKIDFTQKAAFISYSPVYLNGTPEQPIIILSSDSSASGFTIIGAKEKSQVNHTHFLHLNTMNGKSWVLTGAVTFYESDVEFYSSVFSHNHCEDALNVIRSKFQMRDCLILQTQADGFDADFCIGEVENSVFRSTGNDGLDVSGSIIKVKNCSFFEIGDKGISAGENSKVTATTLTIQNSQTAVASKDQSVLKIQKISISDCEYGLVAFQKKAEFGPAKIVVSELIEASVLNLFWIEKGSTAKVAGELHEGTVTKNQ